MACQRSVFIRKRSYFSSLQVNFKITKEFNFREYLAIELARTNICFIFNSAGVGRTGTLVAIDSLLQQLDSEGQVLIFNTICDLRHQRNFLVQSLVRYSIFIYPRCDNDFILILFFFFDSYRNSIFLYIER